MCNELSLLQQLHLDGYRVDKVSLTSQTEPVAAAAEQQLQVLFVMLG